jgi:hypothetical protein
VRCGTDKISFARVDADKLGKAPVNPGTALTDEIAFKKAK